MKQFLIMAGLLLAAFSAQAQTIDFTGVSISTERVKKVYERKSFVLATGTADIFPEDGKNHVTEILGLRYGMVWHFGFYVGAEIGIGGIPKAGIKDFYNGVLLSGMRKDPRANVVTGGIWRITPAFNLYLGSGVAFGQSLYETLDREWRENNYFISPITELGFIFHMGHFSLSAGGGYIPLDTRSVRATIGLGYNF